MDEGLSLVPQNLQINFDFQNNTGNMVIASALVIFVLAEAAINNDDLDYWNIDDRLNKHRTVRDYDAHIQKMLYSLKKAGSLDAKIVKSSSNNYHFVEFIDLENKSCIRVLHTFNPKSKYMKKYLEMNQDTNNPRFAYIQYSLDTTKTQVRKVKAVIPYIGGNSYISCNLFQQFKIVKGNFGQIRREEINKLLELLKKDVSKGILAEKQNLSNGE